MTKDARDLTAEPIWARSSAFPEAPGGFGWVDAKGRRHPVDSRESLIEILARDRDAEMLLVWSPDDRRMVLPEDLAGAEQAVHDARVQRTHDDHRTACGRMRWGSVAIAVLAGYLVGRSWLSAPDGLVGGERLWGALLVLSRSMVFGMGLLALLVFAFIPWYQSGRRLCELDHGSAADRERIMPVLRFDTWLEFQSAPVTRVMAGMIVLVGIAQWWSADSSIAAAGLVKGAYHQGEWWRLFTAPLLHGNLIHFVMNLMALLYLGKRVELFARWPHLLIVFLFTAAVGGEVTARFHPAPSVGASGGLMGWLGFLLVFESLHRRLVPRSARRRLLAGVVLTGLIGLVGFRFIDNAAHVGGLLAGVVYALVVFPRSTSVNRPSVTPVDRFAGSAAGLVFLGSTVLALLRILSS